MPNTYAAGQRPKPGVFPDAKSEAGRILPQGQAGYTGKLSTCQTRCSRAPCAKGGEGEIGCCEKTMEIQESRKLPSSATDASLLTIYDRYAGLISSSLAMQELPKPTAQIGL